MCPLLSLLWLVYCSDIWELWELELPLIQCNNCFPKFWVFPFFPSAWLYWWIAKGPFGEESEEESQYPLVVLLQVPSFLNGTQTFLH